LVKEVKKQFKMCLNRGLDSIILNTVYKWKSMELVHSGG
jgi:hypothetical protein